MAKKKILNAAEMGRKGRARKTTAQAEAARANGVKGGRPPKFEVGDRAIGREKAPASFRGRAGKITEIGPGRAEYGVRFDDTKVVEYVMSWWIDPA